MNEKQRELFHSLIRTAQASGLSPRQSLVSVLSFARSVSYAATVEAVAEQGADLDAILFIISGEKGEKVDVTPEVADYLRNLSRTGGKKE